MRSPPNDDAGWMRQALALARRGLGRTSPNPAVGAVLVRNNRLLGGGWHHRAGQPHAEIEALRDAACRGHDPRGATLYVTLEPCSTHGRTPPCTEAVIAAGIRRVVVAATDPNPRHAGRGFDLLRKSGIEVVSGVLAAEAGELNEAFDHWIVHRTPFVILKAAMSLDGKIATTTGESKWITGERARAHALRVRGRVDAILVGVNTVIADDPALTRRGPGARRQPPLRRIVVDSRARTPLAARVVADEFRALTTVVVTETATLRRVQALERRVRVLRSPTGDSGRVDLGWLMRKLGEESVTSLLVEGGGEVHGAFLRARLVHRVNLYFAPLVLGGARARRAFAGIGAGTREELAALSDGRMRTLGADLFLTSRLEG